MDASVLALRNLASGRPGRRGRAEAAAQKVSGLGVLGQRRPRSIPSAAGSSHTLLRLSRCRPVRSAELWGGGRYFRGLGHPPGRGGLGPRRHSPVCAGPRPAGLGGGSGLDRVPHAPADRIWGAAHWTSTPGPPCRVLPAQQHLTCRHLEHRGVRRYR